MQGIYQIVLMEHDVNGIVAIHVSQKGTSKVDIRFCQQARQRTVY